MNNIFGWIMVLFNYVVGFFVMFFCFFDGFLGMVGGIDERVGWKLKIRN
jgi:hypothetical protein